MRSYFSELIANVGLSLGFEVQLEPHYQQAGLVIFPQGGRSYFRGAHFDINGLGAAEIATDKDYTAFFLRQKFPVPEGSTFFDSEVCRLLGTTDRDIDAGYRYANRLGMPVVVKPNSKSQGLCVAKVFSKDDF